MKKILILLAALALLPVTGDALALEEHPDTHVVAKGESLVRILRARGVSEREMPRYFGAVKAINPDLKSIDHLVPGRTVNLPTLAYFQPASTGSSASAGRLAQAEPSSTLGNAPTATPAADNTATPPADAPADNNAKPIAVPDNTAKPVTGGNGETPTTAQPKAAASSRKALPRSNIFLSMDFTDVDLPVLIKFMSEQTKKNFIFDERVTGKITIISPRKVTLDEAYDVFISVLQVKGFTTIEQGNAIKIVPLSTAKQENLPYAKDPDGTSVSEFVTRLIPLQYVDSPEIVQLLAPLMSKDGLITSFTTSNTLILIDSRANVDRIVRIISEIDAEGATSILRIISLKNASCVEIGKTLESIYQDSAAGAAVQPGAGARARRPRTGKGGHTGGIKVIPDPRTNSILILAGKDQMPEIEDLVAKLDIPSPENTGKINVYYLENADAEEMAKVLSNLADKKAGAAPVATAQAPATIKSVITAELEGGVKITADKSTNSLIIIASVNDYQTLVEVIKKLDIRRRQVYVEGLIMEISLDKARDLGIEYRAAIQTGGNNGAVISGTNFDFAGNVNSLFTALAGGNPLMFSGSGLIAGGIAGNVTLPDGSKIPAITAILRAAQTNTNVNILSSPHLLTLDNKEAEIIVGENVPFITSNLTNTANSSNLSTNVANTIERKDVGITLRLTPHIHESDFVNLDIYQESSAVKGDSVLNVNQVGPTTTKRSAKTSVIVRSGDTVVLGGMMQETISTVKKQVPLLGDIPLLGYLFKYNSVSRSKTNMLIFLTPKIIKNPADMASIAADKQKAMDKFIDQNKDEVERIIPDKKGSAPK
ncbi:MAG TPA: type II secretion system secretin GspD [Candidatus Deferrimicrobiaceae bacterium]